MRINWPLFLLGGGLALGFLWPFHVDPIPSFSSEWITGMGLLMAVLWLLRGPVSIWRFPRILTFVAPVALLLVSQLMTGRLAFPENGVFGLVFMLAAVLTGLVVSTARTADANDSAVYLFWALWAAGMVSGLSALAQWVGWDRFLQPFVFPMDAVALRGRPTGNIAQPNLLSTLCALGMVASGWLGLRRTAPGWLALGSALFMAFIVGLTGSRTAILFVPVMLAALYWHVVRSGQPKTGRRWALLLVPMSVIGAHFMVPFLTGVIGSGLVSQEVRALNMGSESRQQLWVIGLAALQDAGWWGHGFGNFTRSVVFNGAKLGLEDTGLAHHSHNVFLQLGIDFGWAGLFLVLLLSVGHVFKNRLYRGLTDERVAAMAGVLILLIHSQLEFPLWYLHFWLVFIWMLVVADVDLVEIGQARLVRNGMTAVVVGGLMFGAWLYHDYWQTHRKMLPLFSNDPQGQMASAEDIRRWTLFSSYDEYMHHMFGVLRFPLSQTEIAKRRSATERHAYPLALIRMAVIEVLLGDNVRAARYLDALKSMHPQFQGEIKPQFDGACQAFQNKALCDFAKTL